MNPDQVINWLTSQYKTKGILKEVLREWIIDKLDIKYEATKKDVYITNIREHGGTIYFDTEADDYY